MRNFAHTNAKNGACILTSVVYLSCGVSCEPTTVKPPAPPPPQPAATVKTSPEQFIPRPTRQLSSAEILAWRPSNSGDISWATYKTQWARLAEKSPDNALDLLAQTTDEIAFAAAAESFVDGLRNSDYGKILDTAAGKLSKNNFETIYWRILAKLSGDPLKTQAMIEVLRGKADTKILGFHLGAAHLQTALKEAATGEWGRELASAVLCRNARIIKAKDYIAMEQQYNLPPECLAGYLEGAFLNDPLEATKVLRQKATEPSANAAAWGVIDAARPHEVADWSHKLLSSKSLQVSEWTAAAFAYRMRPMDPAVAATWEKFITTPELLEQCRTSAVERIQQSRQSSKKE
jgi:hypothetical protein